MEVPSEKLKRKGYCFAQVQFNSAWWIFQKVFTLKWKADWCLYSTRYVNHIKVNHFLHFVYPGIYPSSFTNVCFLNKDWVFNVLFHEKRSQNYCEMQVEVEVDKLHASQWVNATVLVGVQGVKLLNIFNSFTSGGQINSLK